MKKFFNKNPKLLLLLAILFAALAYGSYRLHKELAKPTSMPWPEFAKLIEEKKVTDLELLKQDAATYLKGKVDGKETQTEVYLPFETKLDEFLAKNGFPQIPQKARTSFNPAQLMAILLPLIILIFLFRLMSQGRMMGKLKRIEPQNVKVTFADVAGIDEAKEEVMELVDFLKNPKKFISLGAKIPKGVLFVGPPGTGKTMLAGAVAKEAGVPFFSRSGADFVELFVGLGASRVRNTFETLAKNAPAIFFIDEIDAIGKKRTTMGDGGSSERDQTLNALLVAMDGIDPQKGIIVIAATNRLDSLDTALTRPGRFDREVHINLPDVKGREEILKVHAKGVKIQAEANLAKLAKATPGMSGAELANVINEAALYAARKNLGAVDNNSLEYARDKVRWGKARTLAMTPKQKETTTVHEAGHTIVSLLLKHVDPLHKVTIIPRGPSLGSTMFLPEDDKYLCYKKEAVEQMALLLGGRACEEIFLDDYSSGARGDIHSATKLARQMIGQWGMDDWLIEIDESSSDITKAEVDRKANELVKSGLDLARKLISENKESTGAIIQALREKETLSEEEVRALLVTPTQTEE